MAKASWGGYHHVLREAALLGGGVLCVALIAWLDFITGPHLSCSIFYLIPVAACAWWGGFPHGILLALAGSIGWHLVDWLENPLIPEIIGVWNGIARFATLALTSSLISRLHTGMLRERQFARTDSLTGAANARTFYETAATEAERAGRAGRPLTVAYLDLDNFKQLNDRMGHATGDAALIHVVQVSRVNLRSSDLVARLGGDEFALLLPEMEANGALGLLGRVQELLADEMIRKGWPVTVSIGAITFIRPTWDVDLMVQRVDALMYQAKKNGKGRLVHHIEQDAQGATGEKSPQVNRRAGGRVICNRPANARPEGQEQEVFVIVRDISVRGVGLFLEQSFPPGTLLIVEPSLTHGPKTLLAKVVRTSPEGEGWIHGCELPTRLESADLRAWYDHSLVKPCDR